MRIKCKKILIDNPESNPPLKQTDWLTVGKEYVVLTVYKSRNEISYHIESDYNDEPVIVDAEQFQVLTNYIPSNWEIKVKDYENGTYYLKLAPRAWNEADFDFWEDITNISGPFDKYRYSPYMPNHVPREVTLFLQERDIIYREEEEYQKKLKSKSSS